MLSKAEIEGSADDSQRWVCAVELQKLESQFVLDLGVVAESFESESNARG